MKRAALFLVFLLLTALMLASVPPFNENYYYPRSVIVCFSRDAVSNERGVINYETRDGIVHTGLMSFDQLSQEFYFTTLKQLHPDVKDKAWNENGIYIQNIYQITLETNDRIEEATTALSNNQYILFAEYEAINRIDFIPDDPYYDDQWHLPQIQCPEAWDWTVGSDEIIIGIVDSGIYWIHPDLAENIWVNEAELNAGMTINWETGVISGGNGIDEDGNNKIDDVIGWNFYNNNNNTLQTTAANDHGTHVGGCAGAIGNNGIGVSGSSMVVKLMVSKHTGSTPDTNIYNGYDGIIYCTDTGANIINCSWGGPGGGPYANTVVNYATTHGVLVVGAAGNDDQNNDIIPHYPSDAVNCLSVAATDQNDLKTYFSNYGTDIDLCAPGIDIKSTVIGGVGYASYQGTSMSAPIVSGSCALALSVHPEEIGNPMTLKTRMQSTTDYIDDLNPGYEGMLGSGRLNAYQAAMYDLIPSLFISDYHFYEVEGDGDGLPNPGELCNVELMVQNNWFAQGFWAEAHDVTVTIATDNPEITIIAGTETYEISYIGPLGSHWNYSNPIQITTPETSSLYNLEFTVTITANQDSQFPYEVVHDFMIQLTLLQDGWPYDVSGTSTSSGIIVDIDNDNIKEIIFGDQNGYLHVVNNYGTPFGNFPYDFGGNISSAVAVGNINGDDYKEIVFNNEDGFIHAIDYLGDLVFAYDAGGIFKGNPIIADVDGNGSMEIIAVTFTGNKAIVLNSDGSDYPNFPVTLSCGGTLSSPAVGDLDGDGIMEIIAASLSGAIYAISTATGENLANWPYSIGTNSWKGPIVANFDGDPDPEVMVAAATGDLVVIEHDGTLKFSREIDGQIKTCPVIGDIDGNRSVECVIINSDGDVYVIDGNGNDLGIFPVSIGAAVESSPILADMDNNGTMDIVFGDFLGYLHVLDYTGNETANYPYYIGSTIKVGPALADADGDGDPEIIIPNQSAYALVDHKFNVAASQIAWSCFKRNPCRTGNGFDPTTGTSGDIIPALVTNLGRNYPNPFNPSTNIAFSLEKDSYVNLEIFNIKGQSVKVLLAEQVQRGAHFIEWDGRDEQNHPVGSGIYLYRLQTGDYQSARKMMMIK